jgi:hypothetical protein
MMDINRNNYEAYLLDYLENNLTTGQVAELMVFLQANPDLQVDLEDISLLTVKPDPSLVFDDKEGLKHCDIKPYAFLTGENYEEYLVASMDGELSSEEEKDLEIFMGLNPQVKEDYELYRLTLLSPDTSIVYPSKAELKKGAFGVSVNTSRRWVYVSLSAAASIALLIGIFLNFSPQTATDQLAQSKVNSKSQTITIPERKPVFPSYSEPIDRKQPQNNTENISSSTTNQASIIREKIAYTGTTQKDDIGEIHIIAAAGIKELYLPSAETDKLVGSTRTYYGELCGFIQLREQREYQEYLDARQARPWYAKAFTGVKTLVAGPDEYDPKGVQRDDKIWMLAEAGIKGINYLTNRDLYLKRQLDEDGRTSAYAIASDRFEYTDKVEKK